MSTPTQPHPLVLASVSPRRRELLREAGYTFEIADPPFAEPDEQRPHVSPEQYTESLAYFKASSVAAAHRNKTILAADTIAFIDGEIIGKPADRDDARRILQRLSNTTHRVITGVALLDPATDRRMIDHDISTIVCRHLSPEQIETYLDTNQWQGKAGAYGIQDHGDLFVEQVVGSFTNVVGLPMEKLAAMFAAWK